MRTAVITMVLALMAGSAKAQGAPAAAKPAGPDRCHVGVYRLSDGRLVDIAPTSDGPLRWRTMDGRTGRLTLAADGSLASTRGWTGAPDGVRVAFKGCADDAITFDGKAGARVPLEVTETTFTGANSTRLAGRLVLPKGNKAVPVSVLVHGSEDYSGREYYFEPRAWPAQGVGVFVYDKRGTGGSAGKYTQDFHVLSDDAAAAATEARRLGGKRIARLGFDGGSQGGWIAPLAATKVPADYVIVRFGMAESPLAEDRGETLRALKDKGYGPDVLAKARQVTDATGRIMASHFKDGFTELNALKAQWSGEPWWNDLDGEFTGEVAKSPEAAVRAIGPTRDQGTTWDYNPMPVLSSVRAPMLWILAADDLEAPVEETRARMVGLAKGGRPVTVLQYPNADHGIRVFEVVDGKRSYLGYPDGYYRAVLDFAKTGKATGTYGTAERLTP